MRGVGDAEDGDGDVEGGEALRPRRGSDSRNAAAVAARQRTASPRRAGTAAMESPATALITPMAA
ncbi:hypothetical protein WKI71_34415 [Streptomyces sp. MS1.AVA.1]|uniref:Uncharacterized protein n=1 Tax=Streptomyces machairae TaxID=3134109 RepID=A0ABU8URT2_9ACTN